jgi:hypothetical protein
MKLVVLKTEPSNGLVKFFGLVAAMFIAFAVLFFSTSGSESLGGPALVVAGISAVVAFGNRSGVTRDRALAAQWLAMVESKTAAMNATTTVPVVECPLALQKNEECLWAGQASWYEYRAVTRRVNYHGVTASIPIGMGLKYRAGSISAGAARETELVPIDDGELYVTTKRLLYDGKLKNTTIALSAIVKLQLFQGGIIVEKGTGKSPHLMIATGAEDAALLITRQLS